MATAGAWWPLHGTYGGAGLDVSWPAFLAAVVAWAIGGGGFTGTTAGRPPSADGPTVTPSARAARQAP